jgi:hypothetical protein
MNNDKLNNNSFIGKWWLSNNPKNTIQGTLTFNNSAEATFFTIDSFENDTRIDFKNYDLIIGFASNSEGKESLFILYDVTQKRHTSGKLTKKIFSVAKCLAGKSGNKQPEDRFDTLYLSSDLWSDFVQECGLDISNIPNEERFEYQINYLQPEPILLYGDNIFRIVIFFRSFLNARNKNFGIFVEPSLTLKFKNSISLKNLIGFRTKLERLIMVIFERQHYFKRSYNF